MNLQELVARARLLFEGAPKRIRVFELVNGKRSAKEIARKSGRSLSSTLADLQKMKDMELLRFHEDSTGKPVRKSDSIVYEKHPLIKHLSKTYFEEPTRLPLPKKRDKSRSQLTIQAIRIPSKQEVLDICRTGEDQLYEFKRAGGEIRDIVKEICAFANTREGGWLFYGVEDDGTISGSDMRRQKLDERLQGSLRSNISPSLTVRILEKDVLGHKIILIAVPPWNRRDVYQMDGRVYIRKGTIKTLATPEELKTLHQGKYVV